MRSANAAALFSLYLANHCCAMLFEESPDPKISANMIRRRQEEEKKKERKRKKSQS